MNKIKFSIIINLFFMLYSVDISLVYANQYILKSILSVNGDIITNYDISIRSNLIKKILNTTKNLQKNLINRYNSDNIRKNIIDDLIKEKIKITESKRYGIEATEEEIKQGITISANRFGIEETQLKDILSKAGCKKEIWINNKINICYQMIISDIVWAKFSGMFFSSQISDSEKEIEEEVQRYTEYVNSIVNDLNISQLILKNKQEAENTYSKIKDGGCEIFNKEIQNALLGSGNLGFIKLHDTSKVVGEHIKSLPIGIVSKPLKNKDNNYYLYIICDKKIDKDLEKKLIPIKEMRLRISNAIINNKLETISKKHLEKLFNSAFIEYM